MLRYAVMLLFLVTLEVHGFGLRGSLKTRFEYTGIGIQGMEPHWVSAAPFRIMLSERAGDARFSLDYAITPSAGDPALGCSRADSALSPYRIADLSMRLLPSDPDSSTAFSVLQNLDRFNASIRLPFATLTVGRQPVYWGVSRSVSPTDFIAPFQYGTLDTEYRVGVDAVRAVFPLGMLSQIDAGWLFGQDAKLSGSGGWLRGRFYLFETDAVIMAGAFRENLIFGGSLNRSIGDATGWVETAAVITGAMSGAGADGGTSWSLSLGTARSWLDARLSGHLEYHFNSAGASSADGYETVVVEPAYTDGDAYLLGRHYLAPGASLMVTPLLHLDCGGLVNLADPSAFVSLSASYGLTENTILTSGASLGLGRDRGPGGTVRSEFGEWPGSVFLSGALYF